jgi:NAD(P)-dependent dehydrogenase (short-subunit alcohol dehydrogenase family)
MNTGVLEGKTVLVTGAATGIGRAIAHACARSGARLVLGDIDAAALEHTAGSLRAGKISVVAQRCDIRRIEDIAALVTTGERAFGYPDVVYANAGIFMAPCAPWDVSEEEFASIVDVNLTGTWRTFKVVLPRMVERGSGAIVATASVAGMVGADGVAPYVASKHGIVGLVKSAAISVAKSGVRNNAICPGVIDTAMVERLVADQPDLREALLVMKPMGRMGTADEVAAAALWLGTDQSSFVTGLALAVDGGFLAQ